MNTYELTIVLAGSATDAKKKAVQENIEKVISSLKGKVKKTDDLGKIEPAFKIKGEEQGIFLNFELELDKSFAKKVNEKLRLEDDIMRYLLVRSKD